VHCGVLWSRIQGLAGLNVQVLGRLLSGSALAPDEDRERTVRSTVLWCGRAEVLAGVESTADFVSSIVQLVAAVDAHTDAGWVAAVG
jgi:hypothetical protein